MSFFVLNNHLFDDDDYAICEKVKPVNLGDCDYCDLCGGAISLLKWLPPYEVRVTKKRLGDFLFGGVHPFLVSQQVKDLYESGGYRGIESFSQVQLYFRRRLLDVAYYFPHIPSNYHKADLDRCGIKYDPAANCPRCQIGGEMDDSGMTGMYWENEAAIKEDVFKAKATSQYAFSQRLKEAMGLAGITNTVFVPAAEYVPKSALAQRSN
jgi:hypothetical protein